ncbi:hypothetical protein [Fuscovulum ytuae]|uniref:Uncharacterized protein n=1 Tax=Fuscovulum ytuae TaxID=3042299 RepID=A0ABY8Q990_9RHOB|nr:hypothetical protein [Fuscovulum sp. YMD61]WGV17443.1 hypothetical protein QF092_06535 [Fuscovulum sp. YMD61]
MSERLSSVEIEDVLSSIRRLVSEDLRPSPKSEAAAPSVAAAAEAPAGDKLILTPALRIDPETEEAAKASEASVPSFQSVRQGRGASVVDRVTRAMPEEDWEPVAEAAAEPRSDWASEAEAAVEAAGEAWSEAPVAPVEQTADPSMEMEAEEAEAPMVTEAEDWPPSDAPEANWSDPGEQAPMEAEAPEDPGWSEVEPMAIDRPTPVEGGLPAPESAVPSDLPDWARMETEVEAEPEVALESAPAATAGPSAVSEDADWADAAEAEIRRELEDEATATVFARFDDDDHDDRHFDEEMLRDLVRDIIREELQGALGERITRNVRKLVRAEIARALAVRDFE